MVPLLSSAAENRRPGSTSQSLEGHHLEKLIKSGFRHTHTSMMTACFVTHLQCKVRPNLTYEFLFLFISNHFRVTVTLLLTRRGRANCFASSIAAQADLAQRHCFADRGRVATPVLPHPRASRVTPPMHRKFHNIFSPSISE